MANIAPCPYPGCRDIDGNPRLTRDVICEPSRRHYHHVLDRLLLSYVLLRATLPQPAQTTGNHRTKITTREYGHPAEWASDTARAVADQLGEAHDGLAEHLHHDPPPHPGNREPGRVATAHHYLSCWFAELCTYPAAADTAEALYDLDRDIRRGLGATTRQQHLPVPCPQCQLQLLVRNLERTGQDTVDCLGCGHVIPASHYGWWARVLLDDVIDDAPD